MARTPKAGAVVAWDRLRAEIAEGAGVVGPEAIEAAWRLVIEALDDLRTEVGPLLGRDPVGGDDEEEVS